MTKEESVQLGAVSAAVGYQSDEIKEIKGSVLRIEEKLDNMDSKFITRREAGAVTGFFSFLVAVGTWLGLRH